MRILGIESSCDETAVAVVNDQKEILAHTVLSQLKQHQPYGGVVPEIAARAHIDVLDVLVKETMQEAGIEDYSQLDGIAVTAGPGLIGGVIVGVTMAKAIASAAKIPFIPINHLEGHALTVRLTDEVEFPYLLLLFSGGHCQILLVEGVKRYRQLGATMDDALGEAFDKVAKMLGLGYPGGPIVERYAKEGDGNRFGFPRSMVGKDHCDFSFSGLKTAVSRQIAVLLEGKDTLSEGDRQDICASFQVSCGDIVCDRFEQALKLLRSENVTVGDVVLAGGVAANQYLRGRIEAVAMEYGVRFVAPPVGLCTDNAAMIAWAGVEHMQLQYQESLDFAPRARWPLEQL